MKQEFRQFTLYLGRDRSSSIVLHYPWWCRYFLKFFKLKIYSGFMGKTEFDLDLNYKTDGTFKKNSIIDIKHLKKAWDYSSISNKWEKKAPVCNRCKKQNRWLVLIENIETGDKYFVCKCGNEQDLK